MLGKIFSWILFALLSNVGSNQTTDDTITNQTIRIDENTKMVIMGTRHGNRLPDRFINIDLTKWGFEGASELTQFGKRQSFGIGKQLREFVGSLTRRNYHSSEAIFYTSDANRCQMTLQTLLAGFYPPDTFSEWNTALDWTPIPYVIDKPMLRMYSLNNCTKNDEAWNPIRNDLLPDLKESIQKNRLLLEYISNNTGWEASIQSATDLADNLIEMQLYGDKFPEWITNPTLDGYNEKKLKDEILSFAERHQIECTEFEPCRKTMGGLWLNNILMNLQNALNGENHPKIVLYVSHTETTLSVMKLMYITEKNLNFGSGFLIEYRIKPIPAIRLLLHHPVAIDGHLIYQAIYEKRLAEIADQEHWIPVEKFISLVQSNTFADWEQACGLKLSHCEALNGGGLTLLSQRTWILFIALPLLTLITRFSS